MKHTNQNKIQSEYNCKPHKYEKIKPFLALQWEKARNELDMTDDSDLEDLRSFNDPEYSKKYRRSKKNQKIWLERFFHYYTGNLIFAPNNTVVSYVRIYKCANEAIYNNLNGIIRFGQGMPHERRFHTNINLQTHKDQLKLKKNIATAKIDNFSRLADNNQIYWKFNLTDNFRAKNANFKTFTFIRDPLQHFESGNCVRYKFNRT